MNMNMKSIEIQQSLTSLKEINITDHHVITILQKIRNDAMATKGGVQRLVNLACVPCILKLLYRYISMDKTETTKEKAASESKVSIALSIVANMLMEKRARQQVKRDGIETLVALLTNCSDKEVQLRCCRSLGNLAMESSSHLAIAQAQALPALVKVLEIQYVEVEKQNSVEASTTESGRKTVDDSSENEIHVEANFPSVSMVKAACRILRYISEDSKVRQQLVETGMVAALARLVKSEELELVGYVIRTLSELWTKMNKRITEKMASEVAQAGIMKNLMDLIDSEDDKLSHQAFTVFLPLADHPRSAALIGASDGVDFFFSHIDSARRHIINRDVISGLCQLAREAVNRAKMRLLGGLKVFLDSLQDDGLVEVQDRVISCLVNFLYDDTSLNVMLEDGLVDVLLAHLQRCGDYTSDLSLCLYESSVDLLKPVENSPDCSASNSRRAVADVSDANDPSFSKSKSTEGSLTCDFGSEKKLQPDELKACLETSQLERPKNPEAMPESKSVNSVKDNAARFPTDGNSSNTATVSGNSHASEEDQDACGDGEEELIEGQVSTAQVNVAEERVSMAGATEAGFGEERESGGEPEPGPPDAASRQLYSMNSPTYQAETTWCMEDYHPGVTCLPYNTSVSPGSATTYSDDSSGPSVRSPYSPLSTLSYFSPSRSIQVSPSHSSPASSPAYASSTLSPAHSRCESEADSSYCSGTCTPGGVMLECVSPLRTPTGASSPYWGQSSSPCHSSFGKFHDQAPVFSSSEDDCTEDEDIVTGGGDGAAGGMPSDLSKRLKLLTEENLMAQEQADDDYQIQKPTADETANQFTNIPRESENHTFSQAFHQLETTTPVLPKRAVHGLGRDSTQNNPEDSFVKTSFMASDCADEKGTVHIQPLDQPLLSESAIKGVSPESDVAKWKLVNVGSPQFSTQTYQCEKRFFKVRESPKDDGSEGESAAKRRKLQHRPGKHASVTQKNILILLSRLSVHDELSKHLATSKVICCLTDHLALASEPHDRCVRVLSRIMSSPHCLTPLLTMCAPATLVKTLMLDSGSVMAWHDAVLSAEGGPLRASGSPVCRHLSVEEHDMRSLMMMSIGVAQNFSTEAGLLMSNETKPCSVPKDGQPSPELGKKHCKGEPGPNVDKPDSRDNEADSSPKKLRQNLARVGAQLLEDLSNQAMSPYGEGVIMHTFHRLPASRQLAFATSLLFLQTHWPRERRQKFLFHKGGLDRVLSALRTPCAGSPVIKDVMVLGLVFLAHRLVIRPRFQPSDTLHLLDKAVEKLKQGQASSEELDPSLEARELQRERDEGGNVCQYAMVEKDLQIVVEEGRSIQASREMLSRNSQVFAAMLQGRYRESSQSEVSISDAPHEVLTPVLHFLHGCDEQCPTLKSLLSSSDEGNSAGDDPSTIKSKQASSPPHRTLPYPQSGQVSSRELRLKRVLDVIVLADRYLLPDLVGCLCAAVSTSLLDQTCVEEVLRFACFHGLLDLAEDCMKMLLLSSWSIAEIANSVITLAESECGAETVAVISTLLKRGVADTP